jgi:hypothetical protein
VRNVENVQFAHTTPDFLAFTHQNRGTPHFSPMNTPPKHTQAELEAAALQMTYDQIGVKLQYEAAKAANPKIWLKILNRTKALARRFREGK